MKILNLIWGYSLGAGIDKCFLTYAKLGNVDNSIIVKSACIHIQNIKSHTETLADIELTIISIRNRCDMSWINKLHDLINREQPDVIFTHGFNGAIMMLIEKIIKKDNTRLICSYHGAYHAPKPLKRILEPIYNLLTIYVYRKYANKIICVTNQSRIYLSTKGVPAYKITTVHNGIENTASNTCVDLSYYNPLGCTIITASRITAIKGLRYLIDALAIIKKRNIPFHYFMIGEGPELELLKKRAHDYELDNNISFVGFQDNIIEWLNACDIFALPSLEENHSIAILEAMRAGKAIVATSVGGNGESITNGIEGTLVPSKNPEAFADALLKLMGDATLRQTMGLAARKRFITEFSEKAMQHNLIKVLKS